MFYCSNTVSLHYGFYSLVVAVWIYNHPVLTNVSCNSIIGTLDWIHFIPSFHEPWERLFGVRSCTNYWPSWHMDNTNDWWEEVVILVFISCRGSRLLIRHITYLMDDKDVAVKSIYACMHTIRKKSIYWVLKWKILEHKTAAVVPCPRLTYELIPDLLYCFYYASGGLITICATIYCFENELQEQLLTAYGFLCLYCLYKVSNNIR